jgi:MFS family permease
MKKSVGYFELVRKNGNYRNLWFGQIISLLGDWFNLIASASLIATLTQSGVAVGSLFVVRMLAPFLISPLAGVFADRYNRKRLLITADISRAFIVLGFLFVREPSQVWLLYALTAVQLSISGFFYPARSAILPDIVSTEELGVANALGSSTWSIMLSLGAALGGLAAGKWGIYPAFIIDSASFVFSAAFISRISYRPPTSSPSASGTISATLKEYLDGLRYLLAKRDILVISLLKAVNSLATGAFQVVQVYLAEQIYVIGTGGSISLGLFYTVVGAGTGLGPIWARKYTGDREQLIRIAIAVSYLIGVTGLLMTVPLPAFWLVLIGTFVRGLGGGVNWVFSTQLLLLSVPNRMLGRVFSVEYAMMTLAGAAAAYLGGWGLDQPSLGITGTLWMMVILSFIFGLLWTLWIIQGKGAITGNQDE